MPTHIDEIKSYWDARSEKWLTVTGERKPDDYDLENFSKLTEREDAIGLVLGATPMLLNIPARKITCIDVSKKMLDLLPESNAEIVVGEWTNTGLEDASVDWVAGDGVLSMLEYPDGYKTLLEEIERILKPGGVFVVRMFTHDGIRNSDIEMFKVALTLLDEQYNVVVNDIYLKSPDSVNCNGFDATFSFPPTNEIVHVLCNRLTLKGVSLNGTFPIASFQKI